MVHVASPPALGQDAEVPQEGNLISIPISKISALGCLPWLDLGMETVMPPSHGVEP